MESGGRKAEGGGRGGSGAGRGTGGGAEARGGRQEGTVEGGEGAGCGVVLTCDRRSHMRLSSVLLVSSVGMIRSSARTSKIPSSIPPVLGRSARMGHSTGAWPMYEVYVLPLFNACGHPGPVGLARIAFPGHVIGDSVNAQARAQVSNNNMCKLTPLETV